MMSFIYFRWNFNLNRIYQSGVFTRLTLLVLTVDVLSPTTWIGGEARVNKNVSTFCYVMNSPMWIFYLSVAARTTWHVYGRSQSARRLQKKRKIRRQGRQSWHGGSQEFYFSIFEVWERNHPPSFYLMSSVESPDENNEHDILHNRPLTH